MQDMRVADTLNSRAGSSFVDDVSTFRYDSRPSTPRSYSQFSTPFHSSLAGLDGEAGRIQINEGHTKVIL